MTEKNSYREILKSSSIIGGASVINILVGLLRTKVLAVLLGPAGVGLAGLLNSMAATASSVAGMGLANVGTRQIAEAVGEDNQTAIAAARRALFWGTLILSVLGGLLFLLLREPLAQWLFGNTNNAGLVGWMAIAVVLSVASGSQTALLNGLRRIPDLARISVYSALLSTAMGVSAIWAFGQAGLVLFVLSTPIASFMFGHWYVAKTGKLSGQATPVSVLITQWRVMAALGFAFMLSGLVGNAGQLLVRTIVQNELGLDALGHFQAAWMISMTYIGFVLTAMGTDYYPRLTAVIKDHQAVNRLVNEQTEVVLILAGPIFLAMIGLAPWVISLLYSAQFSEATIILQWQVLGDIIKVVSWPLGFIVLAAGAGKTYLLMESFAIGVYIVAVYLLIPSFGLEAAGISFVFMYAIYIIIVYVLAKLRTGFSWEAKIIKQFFLVFAAAVIIMLANKWSVIGSAIGSVLFSSAFAVYGLLQLNKMTTLPKPIEQFAIYIKTILKK